MASGSFGSITVFIYPPEASYVQKKVDIGAKYLLLPYLHTVAGWILYVLKESGTQRYVI